MRLTFTKHQAILTGLTATALALCVTGCALLWSSDASKYDNTHQNRARSAIFGMADISIVVTFIFLVRE